MSQFVISIAQSPQSIHKIQADRLAPIAGQVLQAASDKLGVWKALATHPQINADMFAALQQDPQIFRKGLAYCAADPELQKTLDGFGAQIVPQTIQQAYPTGQDAAELALYAPSIYQTNQHNWPTHEIVDGMLARHPEPSKLLPFMGAIDFKSIAQPDLIQIAEKVLKNRGTKPSLAYELMSHPDHHQHENEHRGILKLIGALWEHRQDLKHHRELMRGIDQLQHAMNQHGSEHSAIYKDLSKAFRHL